MSATRSKSATIGQIKSRIDLTAGGLTYSVSETDNTVRDVSTAGAWSSNKSPIQAWHPANKSPPTTWCSSQSPRESQRGDNRDSNYENETIPSPLRKIQDLIKMNVESPSLKSRIPVTEQTTPRCRTVVKEQPAPARETPPVVIASVTPPQYSMAKLTGVKFKTRPEVVHNDSLTLTSNHTQVPPVVQTDHLSQTAVLVKDARTDISANLLKKSAIPSAVRLKPSIKAKSGCVQPPMRCGRIHYPNSLGLSSQPTITSKQTNNKTVSEGDNSKITKASSHTCSSPKGHTRSVKSKHSNKGTSAATAKPIVDNKKLDYNKIAQPQIGSFDNINYKPGGGNISIYGYKLKFKEQAKAKVRSLENISYRSGGGQKQITYQVVKKNPNDYPRRKRKGPISLKSTIIKVPLTL